MFNRLILPAPRRRGSRLDFRFVNLINGAGIQSAKMSDRGEDYVLRLTDLNQAAGKTLATIS